MTKHDKDLEKMNVEQLKQEVLQLRNGIRERRDARGDDRCWLDDVQLYKLLPERVTPDMALPPRNTFLKNCEGFYDTRQSPPNLQLHEW